jgi:hypothetical protein
MITGIYITIPSLLFMLRPDRQKAYLPNTPDELRLYGQRRPDKPNNNQIITK